jgi:hypothetical protein
VGIDFAGPATAGAQRRKIVAMVALRLRPRCYAVTPAGWNERLLRADGAGGDGDAATARRREGAIWSV